MRYFDIAFTPSVKRVQALNGSRRGYARFDTAEDANPSPDGLTPREAAFIAGRDSVYMATIGETGWPYIQHRGGPRGFVKVLDPGTLGLADYRGNRQYISLGNAAADDRVALFFMDYPHRRRLKIYGRMRPIEADDPLASALADPDYGAQAERGLLVRVEAFDWNCPQHITPRFTAEELAPVIDALTTRIAELEGERARPPEGRP